MITPRVAILVAADAPAPSIVIDGTPLAGVPSTREQVWAFVRPIRAQVLAENLSVVGLGVKTIVIFPPDSAQIRVEFFQGLAHGDLLAASPLVCLNSLSCALCVGTTWFPELSTCKAVSVVMGEQLFDLRPAA